MCGVLARAILFLGSVFFRSHVLIISPCVTASARDGHLHLVYTELIELRALYSVSQLERRGTGAKFLETRRRQEDTNHAKTSRGQLVPAEPLRTYAALAVFLL